MQPDTEDIDALSLHEQAAIVCSIGACNESVPWDEFGDEFDPNALDRACDVCYRIDGLPVDEEPWGEAEARLRTGRAGRPRAYCARKRGHRAA